MSATEEEDSQDEAHSSLAHLWECPINVNLIGGALPTAENEERREALSL